MSRKNERFYLRRNLILLITSIITITLILNTFLVKASGTNFSNHLPAKNYTLKTSSTDISLYVISPNNLNDQSLKMILNDNEVAATFQYKGYWESDYYGDYWVVTDRREGTISFNAANLQDGFNKVQVSIADTAGNTLTDNWSFTVAEPPKFNNIIPSANSEQVAVNKISAVLSDNTNVDWTTVKLKINAKEVTTPLEINKATNTITYNQGFLTGSYSALLEAMDTTGNLASKSWTFKVDSTPPEMTYLYDFNPGVVITEGNLKFRAELSDFVDIKDNVTLTLDGTSLSIDFRYEGFYDYYGDLVVTSKKYAYVSYEGKVTDGNHTLTLVAEDKLGNKLSKNWNFLVSGKPEISGETPLKYGIDNLMPTISAVVKTPNGFLNPSLISFQVNEKAEDFNYNSSTGLLTYTPSADFNNESENVVKISVLNSTGVSTTSEWTFYINTYPDMKDSNYENCLTCHDSTSFEGSNGILEDVHSDKLSFSGTHSYNDCENCHKYITYPAGCSQCHEFPEGGQAYAPHGSTPTIKYQPVIQDKYSPVRISENREMVDCVLCHQPGTGLSNHDIPELHKTSDESCTKCHAQSITREHAREERTDKNGEQITCNTCHESSVPKVVQAITNKDTSCSACHGEASHDELHVYEQMDSNCVGCHTNTLTKAHKAVNVTCANCHENQDQVVVEAIANKNKVCQTCHTDPLHQNQHMDCATCHKEPLPKINIPAH